MSRADVACMMRIRNEDRWIRRVVERAFEVAQTVVILDDGSDDHTVNKCFQAVRGYPESENISALVHVDSPTRLNGSEGLVSVYQNEDDDNDNTLHIIHSPFRPATVRPLQAVSEIRDKNFLWEYCKSNVPFRHMLCLDGDEILSRAFVENFSKVEQSLADGTDMVIIPFVYLWDVEGKQRVDGIYGPAGDGYPRLRFPRLFSIDRMTPDQLHVMRFSWEGTKGGFHCGSIPRENFRPQRGEPVTGTYVHPIIHLGYLHDADRRRKFEFYNRIDPHNTFEGEYKHIIGEPDVHAPGPLEFAEYVDA